MLSEKPFSQACENNKDPILQVIGKVFVKATTVWEIGSGTGQHGCYFAQKLPHLNWQPTDRKENLQAISRWVKDAGLPNLALPVELDVRDQLWPGTEIDALFSANTLHIMSWPEVEVCFALFCEYLGSNADVCIYGPFNYNGSYTSDSNARFDQWLKDRDSSSGIRDQEAVVQLAQQVGMVLREDVAMPANNRLLVFKKII